MNNVNDAIINCICICILYMFWWGGHCCPMHCDPFFRFIVVPRILVLGRRLNFAQRPIFSGLRCFNKPEISSLNSLPQDMCLGILRPEKIHRLQSGLNSRTLDLEASTLPRDHRGRHAIIKMERLFSSKIQDCIKFSSIGCH